MKIYLASDHAGFDLKKMVKDYLLKNNYDVTDCGALNLREDDDYPDFVAPASEKVANNPSSFGVVFGKSGSGECIVANKIKGARAIVGFSKENVKLARLDNNANILSLGSLIVDKNLALELVDIFLKTPFSNEDRHNRRIAKISKLENLNKV